jgi:hypothetical protein
MMTMFLMLFACREYPVRYSCAETVTTPLSLQENQTVAEVGVSVETTAGWFARDEEVVFDQFVYADGPVVAWLLLSFEPSGVNTLVEQDAGGGPSCDGGTFLDMEGNVSMSIDGFASVVSPATVRTNGEEAWVETMTLEPRFEQWLIDAFLAVRGPCEVFVPQAGIGSHAVGLSYSADCEEGSSGGELISATLTDPTTDGELK